ncbi:MAG: VCBS repeat-containing protein, partial [bacterium]|nr:VCBS repeat-containing protein [bacterium]MDW8163748.1 VCBS repeat-containing protein [Candidatus Omnitrophota bacterium]
IALTAQYKQYVYLYKGLEGGFLNIGNFSTGNGPVKPIFSDFNSDGNPDIAVCDWTDQNVSFFLGDGQGNFNLSSKYIFQYNLQPYDIVSDDFNRDGAIDIVIAGVSSFNLAFLLGNNNGSFTSGGEFSTQIGYPRGLCKGDFDRNGTIDFAVVRGDQDGLSIFYNLQIEKGDISTDGSIDISDVILCLRIAIGLPVVIRNVTYNPPYPEWLIKRANFTDDNTIDISDVIKVLRKAIGLD